VTPVGELLAERIRREGPIGFREFMTQALYHPEHGYYRRARDPFGKHGDFYTAEQLQPVFGILVAQRIRQLARAMGDPADFTVIEPGAGRGMMAEAFAGWNYIPVEYGEALPKGVRGVVFSNEFFDAQPVEVARYEGGVFREQRVAFRDGRFVWTSGGPVSGRDEQYLRAYYPGPEDGRWYEISPAAGLISSLADSLAEGWVLTIDYGFTREESARFPAGTLMSYRRHTALEDVLADPGERDITAHVNFSAVIDLGRRCGLATEKFETLAQMLAGAGEADQFAAALGSGADEARRRTQLKTLLFGMGETFRVLLQRKV
jgi:SAM-dependent MidA family methyltransferase